MDETETKSANLFVSHVNDLEIHRQRWRRISKKSKPGRPVITPTGFRGEFNFLFRGNEMRSFSPNYNVRLIYGGKWAKSLISRLRSGTLQPNEKRHGQLHRMTMCPGVWRTLDCLSKLDLLSNNELRTSWAQSRVDRIPSMNARLVRKVQALSGGASVCSVHFIIWLHPFDGAEDGWPSVYDAA